MLASAAAPVACGGPYLLFGYSGYQLYGVAQLLQAGHNAARIHHVARAHGQEERILPLGLQILRRCGNHAGVPLGEQLGVELVIAVEDGLFVVDLRQGIGVPVLPGVEHGGNLLLLGLGQRLGRLVGRLAPRRR